MDKNKGPLYEPTNIDIDWNNPAVRFDIERRGINGGVETFPKKKAHLK